ncbi:hypothetical protein CQA53_01390 [Helicobacter didelphidarum]|uniref:Uncharacterized protein n=1 Tax=Helicobacter didelphidarum TaxID=2040648 RepID=A0A3D8IRR9_9HELI|nr:hypothetical protein [Helicobacter didelphidarum]RDU67680.1 hypothetical protein CQA53_01390 [Helicobacter didelphidarum]
MGFKSLHELKEFIKEFETELRNKDFVTKSDKFANENVNTKGKKKSKAKCLNDSITQEKQDNTSNKGIYDNHIQDISNILKNKLSSKTKEA